VGMGRCSMIKSCHFYKKKRKKKLGMQKVYVYAIHRQA